MNENKKLTPAEEQAFAELKDQAAPRDLESKVVRALKSANLLREYRIYLRPIYWGVAAVLLVGLGFAAGRQSVVSGQHEPPKPLFALFLHGTGDVPADPRVQYSDYSKWIRALQKTRFATGEELAEQAVMLSGSEDVRMQNAAALTNSTGLSGYFLVEARDRQEAVQIAASCPHLKYNGAIEVRQVNRP